MKLSGREFIIGCPVAALVAAFWIGCSPLAHAQEEAKLPQQSLYEAMLKIAKEKGWVQFRNFGGKQWVYFTPVQNLHCRLKEIRYSVNSVELDKSFAVVKCIKQLPFSYPPGTKPEDIALQLEPGTAKTVAVQVTWEDGKKSEMLVYKPCTDVGEQVCAVPVK